MISVGSEVQVLPGPYFLSALPKESIPRKGAKRALRGTAAQPGVRPAEQLAGAFLFTSGDGPVFNGGLAQLVEHLLCKQGVIGSNPLASMLQGWLLGLAFRRSGILSERELVRCCLPSTDFLARTVWSALGMFFQTVNRIWWIAAWLRCRETLVGETGQRVGWVICLGSV